MALSVMQGVALGAACGGIAIAFFNKALADGAKTWAARLAWILMGVAIGIYVYYAFGGMLYAFDHGVVTAQSRSGGTAVFHRDEHPLLFWIAFLAETVGMSVFGFFSLLCFWKAFEKNR